MKNYKNKLKKKWNGAVKKKKKNKVPLPDRIQSCQETK